MHDSDLVKCNFCAKETAQRMTINPVTKLLERQFLSIFYKGRRIQTCEECATAWNKAFIALQDMFASAIDELYERMVVTQGHAGVVITTGVRDAKEPEDPKQIPGGAEEQAA